MYNNHQKILIIQKNILDNNNQNTLDNDNQNLPDNKRINAYRIIFIG